METEVVLLRRFARTGDAEAFGEIIRRHAGLVYGAAWRILADMDRASDVAQETFLQLTKDAAKVTGSLPGWLHRVATHKAIDLLRRDSSRKHRETRYAAGQPREATSWREISSHIDEGLDALDTELREILVAHFLDGRSTRQIARMRGISQATVSRRLESGVVKLRGRLRRRGLLVAAGALSALLSDRAVNAAPAGLMRELGKIALVGGQAAAVSGSSATITGIACRFQTIIGSALAGAKAKAVAATAAAALSIGSVVAYRQLTGPAIQVAPTPAPAVAGAMRPAWRMSPTVSGGRSAASGVSPYPASGRDASAEGTAYAGMLEDSAVAADPASGSNEDGAEADETMLDDGRYVSRYTLPVPGPNDANDPNAPSARDP
ncbi:MAG: sigma-70 family RNA polymerase sigma factor [Phycisphaerales bacterium]|nr:MAG: sigma-70 family RNA polymerase sigma factor [Phycisphaerales bacterium]